MTTVARIGDIAEQVRGVTYSKSEASAESRSGYQPVVRAGNLQEGRLVLDDLVFVPSSRIAENQKLRRGDVVIATSSGSLDVVGKAAAVLEDLDFGFGAFCKVLRPSNAVDARYFAHFFQTPAYRARMSRAAAGANINNLRTSDLDDLEIPLPPIQAQRRIAAVLDKADDLRAKRVASTSLLGELMVSSFHDLFGAAPYPRKRLGDVLLDHTIGLTRGSTELQPDYPYPYVRMNAIRRDGELDLNDLRRTRASRDEVARYSVRVGDLLFNTRNTRALVGKTAIVRSDRTMLFNNNLMRLRFSEGVEPEYAVAAFREPSVQDQLDRCKSGTTSVFAIYAHDLLKVTIPVPPLEVQRQYCSIVDCARRSLAPAVTHAAQLDDLISSLQHRAFAGKL